MFEVLFLFMSIIFVFGETQPEIQIDQIKPENEAFVFDDKIIGGVPAKIEKYPYQLSLELKGRHSCGAVLIGDKWALTAAHCTNNIPAKQLAIRAGSSSIHRGGQLVKVKAVYQHKSFTTLFAIDYDISVLELEGPISHKYAKPIRLAETKTVVRTGLSGIVTGWGVTSEGGYVSNHLRAVRVPIVNMSKCRAAYGFSQISDRMFCAGANTGGKDACQGDSGGPFVINGELAGIVSWGIGCARAGYPGVYTSVPILREFIRFVSGI